MRIKVLPEDFSVRELIDLPMLKEGQYALYRVRKRGIDGILLQKRIAQALGVSPSKVILPALKDSRAIALQYFSVGPLRKPPRAVSGAGFEAELVGFSARHLSPRDLRGNRFRITVRDLPREGLRSLKEAWEKLSRRGFPNYFDLQRFGSWSPEGGFPGKALIKGEWEKVLRFYLLYPLLGEGVKVRSFKAAAKDLWGDWPKLKERCPRSNLRSVLTFLCDHPRAFKKAVNLITPRILSLWLSAYQSYLWNEVVSRLLQRAFEEGSVKFTYIELPFQKLTVAVGNLPEGLSSQLSGIELPLPTARMKPEGPLGEVLLEVLEAEGLALEDLRAKGLKRAYLGRSRRRLWIRLLSPLWGGEGEDELYPGKGKVTLEFTLPPGTYATMALKVLGVLSGLGPVRGSEKVPEGLDRVEGLLGDLDEDREPAGH